MKKTHKLTKFRREKKMMELDVVNQKCEMQRKNTVYDKKDRRQVKEKLGTLKKRLNYNGGLKS